MVTLDRLEQKIDALTAGMNSITAAQNRQWDKILDFEKHCADAIRILGDRKIAALEGKVDAIGAVLSEILAAKPRAKRRSGKKRT